MNWFSPPNAVIKNPVESEIHRHLKLNSPLGTIKDVLLLNPGCDINARSLMGNTILAEAIINSNFPLVRFLVEECFADVTAKSKGGLSPLAVAVIAKKAEIVEYLLDFEINLEDKTEQGFTCAHIACIKGYVLILLLLLQRGAKPLTTSFQGQSSIGDCKHSHVRQLLVLYQKRISLYMEVFRFCRGLPFKVTRLPIELYLKILLYSTKYGAEFEADCTDIVRVLSKQIVVPFKLHVDDIINYCRTH